jgi:hypothetical protein
MAAFMPKDPNGRQAFSSHALALFLDTIHVRPLNARAASDKHRIPQPRSTDEAWLSCKPFWVND